MNSSERAEPPSDKGLIIHLEVDDIEATMKKIEELGGEDPLPEDEDLGRVRLLRRLP